MRYDGTHPQATVQAVLDKLSHSNDSDVVTILLIDEVFAAGKEVTNDNPDWSELRTSDNTNYVIAIRPLDPSIKKLFTVTPPRDKTTLSTRLLTPYRNSGNIRRLVKYYINHGGNQFLSPDCDSDLPDTVLPPGPLPVWIERTGEVEDSQVLDRVHSQVLDRVEDSQVGLSAWL